MPNVGDPGAISGDGKRVPAGNANFLKQMNQRTLLQLLRKHRRLSRADLARWTGLNPSTISALVTELIDAGIVREQGRAVLASAGRRPEMLEIAPDARYALGVYLGDLYCLGLVADVWGHTVTSFRLPTPAEDDATAVLERVIAETRGMLTRWDGARDKLVGLGLGITGLVDSDQGVAVFSPNIGWENVPVGAMWREAFDLPVIADNDVRALALGEQWFGLGRQVQSLACLHIGAGIGCGVVVGGKVYRGATGGGGEIGHTVIDRDGPLCRCGNHGCLETLAGGQAVIARAAQGLLSSVPTQLSAATRDDPRRLSLPLIFQAARAGDRLARSAIEQTTPYTGIAVANVINTFNPEMVVLSGELIDEGAELILDSIIETARRHAFGKAAKHTPIRVTELGKNASALGTACLAFQQWLDE